MMRRCECPTSMDSARQRNVSSPSALLSGIGFVARSDARIVSAPMPAFFTARSMLRRLLCSATLPDYGNSRLFGPIRNEFVGLHWLDVAGPLQNIVPGLEIREQFRR